MALAMVPGDLLLFFIKIVNGKAWDSIAIESGIKVGGGDPFDGIIRMIYRRASRPDVEEWDAEETKKKKKKKKEKKKMSTLLSRLWQRAGFFTLHFYERIIFLIFNFYCITITAIVE